MFCAGTAQFANNSFRWDFVPNEREVLIANFVIIFWCLAYSFTHYIYHPKSESSLAYDKTDTKKCYIKYKLSTQIVITSLLVVLSAITLYFIDFKSFFVRSLYEKSALNTLFNSSAISKIVLSLIRGFSLWNLMISIQRTKASKSFGSYTLLFISIMCSLVLVPPLGVARYVFACYYGGALLFGFSCLRRKDLFLSFLFLGLLILFPTLNAFRGLYTTNLTSELLIESLGNIRSNFSTSDYDSYTMLVYTIRYCLRVNYTHGFQLLGALLFFIPRSFWPGKPGGSGALIIDTLATTVVNPNVSCPIIAEGFINFGLFGVLCFAIVLALSIKKIDHFYGCGSRQKFMMFDMFYFYLILYSIFLFRGDLMSSFSTLFGYFISFLIVRVLVIQKKNPNL